MKKLLIILLGFLSIGTSASFVPEGVDRELGVQYTLNRHASTYVENDNWHNIKLPKDGDLGIQFEMDLGYEANDDHRVMVNI